jgi:hypothetical protein
VSTERTPEELEREAEQDAHVWAVLDAALHNLVSWQLAEFLDEPADVCEQWVEKFWNGLRDLDDEDRLAAIARLLEPRARVLAEEILGGVS